MSLQVNWTPPIPLTLPTAPPGARCQRSTIPRAPSPAVLLCEQLHLPTAVKATTRRKMSQGQPCLMPSLWQHCHHRAIELGRSRTENRGAGCAGARAPSCPVQATSRESQPGTGRGAPLISPQPVPGAPRRGLSRGDLDPVWAPARALRTPGSRLGGLSWGPECPPG